MRPKHTPGPWYVRKDHNGTRLRTEWVIESTSRAQMLLMEVWDRVTTPEAQLEWRADVEEVDANARLIAAAPDMLAALRDCVAALNVAFSAEGDTFGVHHNDATDALSAAEQAIAKATQEA